MQRATAQMLRGGLLVALILILCVGAVIVRLSFGSLSAEALAEPISRALNERLAPGWSARIASTGVALSAYGPALLAEGIEIRQPDGTVFLSAREGEIAIDPWQLMFGAVDVTAIAFSGIDARLSIMPDGTVHTESTPTLSAPAIPERGSPPPESVTHARPEGGDAFDSAIVGMVDILSDESGLARALDSISLSDARITIAGSSGEDRIHFSEVKADVSRKSADTLDMTMAARSSTGVWTAKGGITGIVTGDRVLEFALEGASLGDILLLANAENGPVAGDLVFSGRARAAVSAQNRLTALEGSIESAPGTLIYHDKDQPPLHVSAFQLEVNREAASGDLLIPKLSLAISGAKFDLDGRVQFGGIETPWRLLLSGKDAVLPPLSETEQPLIIDNLSVDVAGKHGGRVHIERIAASGAGFGVALNGDLGGADNPGGIRLGVQTARSDARAILRFWPQFVTPEPRLYLIENLKAGLLENLNVAVSLSKAQLEASRRREPLAHEVARTQFSATDVTLQAAPGFPALEDATVSGIVTGASAKVSVPSAQAEIVPGQILELSDGSMTMERLTAPIVAAIDFRIRGEATTLVRLLEREALRPIFDLDIPANSVQGAVDLRVDVSLPLIKDLKPDQVATRVTGALQKLSISIGKEKLTNGELALTANDNDLTINGTGQIAGLPATIDVNQPLRRGHDNDRRAGRAIVTLTLDDAARKAQGIDLGNRLRGPVAVRVDTPFGTGAANGSSPMKVDADLTRARIDNLLPGWSKPAGKSGSLTFTLVEQNGFNLSDIVLDAGATARGSARLEPGGSLKSAVLTGVRLSPNDDLSVDVTANGNGYRIGARGNLLDARPFLKDISGGLTGGESGGAGGSLPDIDLDLAVNILAGFNGETLSKSALTLKTRKGSISALNLKGSFSGAALEASMNGGNGDISMRTANAGAMLRFANLYARLAGGNLQAHMTKDAGQLLMHDFAILNEPTMEHLLTESPRKLPVDPGNVAFTKLRIAFTRAPGRIYIQEGVTWGPSVGITFEGNINLQRETLDLSGTYVPAYALNNVFSQVPLLGPLLGGGQYGGLFAVNFRTQGAIASPSVTVNPLSAIAPGIFRKFFDLGRADSKPTATGAN